MIVDLFARHRAAFMATGALVIVVAILVGLLVFARRPPALSQGGSCGNVVNTSNYNAQPAECLWRAYQGHQGAQAVMVDITVEGDPIAYTVDLSRTAVRVSIQSKDKFGPQGLFVYDCSGLTQTVATNDSGHIYLVATGCRGPQGFVDDSGRVTIP